MRNGSSRISAFQRGVLENAGLAEVAYFLKKAKHNLEHAIFAYQNVEFSEKDPGLEALRSKITSIENLILETRTEIDKAAYMMAVSEEEREENPEEK